MIWLYGWFTITEFKAYEKCLFFIEFCKKIYVGEPDHQKKKKLRSNKPAKFEDLQVGYICGTPYHRRFLCCLPNETEPSRLESGF